MQETLQAELNLRLRRGEYPKTVAEIEAKLNAIGYRLDRSGDCRGTSKIMTGDHAGETYPACTTWVVEIDTGRNAFHVDARRDDNFKALQALRYEGTLYAVTSGEIFEI